MTTIAQEIEQGLIDAAIDTGGQQLSGVLFRKGIVITGKEWSPRLDKPSEHPFVCVQGQFSIREQADRNIPATDVKLLVGAHTLSVEPTPEDYVVLSGGKRYEIIRAWQTSQGGTALMYTLQVRA